MWLAVTFAESESDQEQEPSDSETESVDSDLVDEFEAVSTRIVSGSLTKQQRELLTRAVEVLEVMYLTFKKSETTNAFVYNRALALKFYFKALLSGASKIEASQRVASIVCQEAASVSAQAKSIRSLAVSFLSRFEIPQQRKRNHPASWMDDESVRTKCNAYMNSLDAGNH